MFPDDKCEAYPKESTGLTTYIGLIFICWLIFKIIRSLWRGLYTCALGEILGLTVQWNKVGRWAVITGATDGIGKAYAKALAAKGLDIVLISRTPEKLKKVADELENKYRIKTKIISVDVTDEREIYDNIKKELEGLEVGVLVNNVGMSYPYAEYITKVPDAEKFVDNLIKANIVSCTRMTQLVLPQMERRRKGVVINISSLSALSPVPLLSVYSASKAFVNFFTRATHEEYKIKGIVVQSVLPGFVSTNMSRMKPSFTTCTSDAFVYWALKTVGVEDQTYGYPIHKLQGYVQECLCMFLPEQLNLAITHHMMAKLRKRYYKKFGLVDTDVCAENKQTSTNKQ